MSNEQPNERLCPANVVEEFCAYRDHGVPPGGFIRACLENNLCEAFKRADSTNSQALQHIVAWLYWEMPIGLWGDVDRVNDHLLAMLNQRNPHPETDPQTT